MSLSGPASACEASSSRMTWTVSFVDEQTPLAIVQTNELVPMPKLVTWELGSFADTTVPEPAMSDQVPIPTAGGLPDSVVLVAQIFWLVPATAIVGFTSLEITTLSVDEVQGPFVIVQTSVVLWPGKSPVTAEVGDDGLVTVPGPLVMVQEPVPKAGEFAAKLVVPAQIVWSFPAAEVLGAWKTVICCVVDTYPKEYVTV